jgi:hypothetical protein
LEEVRLPVEDAPLYAWMSALEHGLAADGMPRRLFRALTHNMRCGTVSVLNRFDSCGCTPLMQAIAGHHLCVGAMQLLLTHPLVDVAAQDSRLGFEFPIPTALHMALFASQIPAATDILAHMTDAQFSDILSHNRHGGSGSGWPLLVRAVNCGDRLFAPLLKRVMHTVCPSGVCASTEQDADCAMCNLLSATSPRGDTMMSSALTVSPILAIWHALVTAVQCAPSGSCIARLFSDRCWRPPEDLSEDSERRWHWHVMDPLRTAIHLKREPEAVWLITNWLPDWALDQRDCIGQTLVMRAAAANPPMLRVVTALLQRAPQLDVSLREFRILTDDNIRSAMFRPNLELGATAAQLVLSPGDGFAPAIAAIRSALEAASAQSETYKVDSAALLLRFLQSHRPEKRPECSNHPAHSDGHMTATTDPAASVAELPRDIVCLVCAYASLPIATTKTSP